MHRDEINELNEELGGDWLEGTVVESAFSEDSGEWGRDHEY